MGMRKECSQQAANAAQHRLRCLAGHLLADLHDIVCQARPGQTTTLARANLESNEDHGSLVASTHIMSHKKKAAGWLQLAGLPRSTNSRLEWTISGLGL